MKALWRDTPASFSSPTLTFENIYCEPKPLQQGGVPLWVAGTLNRRNFERVVNYGDGWIPIMGATIDDIAADVQRIRAAWADAGRDADALKVQAPLRIAMGDDGRPDLARSMESVPELVAAGVTDVNVTLRAFARDTADAPKAMEDVVRRFHDVA
jgi:alkanesulfonate monooxygenase SsuD/methylene tetrahydromethanopterin reductase-like flavin-dependent oxidoreductase (luciferase family)